MFIFNLVSLWAYLYNLRGGWKGSRIVSTPRMTHCIWIKLLSVVSGYAIFRERGVDQYYRCLRPVFSGPTTIQPAEIPMWISHVLAAEILIIRWWTDPKFPSNHGITCRTSLAAHLRARKGRCYPIFQAKFLKIFGGSLMWMCWFREKICRKPLLHSHAHFLPLFPYIYCTCFGKKHIVSPSTNPLIHLTALFRQGYVWMSCKDVALWLVPALMQSCNFLGPDVSSGAWGQAISGRCFGGIRVKFQV